MSIATKIYLQPTNVIRRFQLSAEQSYTDFDRMVREAFGILNNGNEYAWQYQDEEDDWVSFSSEGEWRDAIFFHQQSNSKLLRLRLSQITQRPAPMWEGRQFCNRQPRHFGIICDGCEAKPIIGERFKCNECPDFDFCGTCYNSEQVRNKHGNHTFTKIERPVRGHCPRRGQWRQDGVVRHWGVRCDGCNQSGIIGDRFKCSECPNFDFCGTCYNSDKLAQHGNHQFTKIEKPIRRHHGFKTFQDGNGDRVFHCPINIDAKEENIKQVENALRQVFGEQFDVEITREEPKPQPAPEEPKVEEKAEEQPKVEEQPVVEEKPVEQPKVEEQPVIIQPPVEEKVVEEPKVAVEEKPVERFPEHMRTLREMGFENEALNRHLLNNYKGDITRVIGSLLQLTGYRNQ